MTQSTGTTKILVSASLFNEILARQPDIELELVRNAVPQIATMLAQRASHTNAQLEERVRKAWDELVRDRTSNYGLPREAREVIVSFLRAECREEAKILVTEAAREMAKEAAQEAVSKAMLNLGKDLQKEVSRARDEVDTYIRETAEREVLALLRAGKLTVAA